MLLNKSGSNVRVRNDSTIKQEEKKEEMIKTQPDRNSYNAKHIVRILSANAKAESLLNAELDKSERLSQANLNAFFL